MCVLCPSELSAWFQTPDILPVGKKFVFRLAQSWIGSRGILDLLCLPGIKRIYAAHIQSLYWKQKINWNKKCVK